MNRDYAGLSGKAAIVTGASSGIGRATAVLLAENGVRMARVSQSKDKLRQLAEELPGSRAFLEDMTKISTIKRMVKAVSCSKLCQTDLSATASRVPMLPMVSKSAVKAGYLLGNFFVMEKRSFRFMSSGSSVNTFRSQRGSEGAGPAGQSIKRP